jgi:uncharacterized membrane protein YccC
MSSANASLPAQVFRPDTPSFWSRESAALKQGIKTGLAGTLTYAIYAGFHFRQGYWAVFAALVVTQANVGASWKAALYRVIGSTCGAIAAAIVFPAFGRSTVGAGLALFLLASGFAYLTALQTAFTAAGITAAIILVYGGQGEPWHLAWLRVLYTFEGAFVAFAVGVLIWPVRAREGLRTKIAKILEGAGALYSAVTAAALQGIDNEGEVKELDRELHDLRRGITQQMDEARSELAFSRFNQSAFQQLIELADQIRRRLTAMAEDNSLYVHARVDPELVPSLPRVAEKTTQHFVALAEAIRQRHSEIKPAGLESAILDLDSDLARLRLGRTASPFTLDRMLPFWALVFNLKEVAQDLKQLESVLPQLG